MNKLYTLLLSLLLSAAATAQNITLTVDGEKWANGTTLTKVYDIEDFSSEMEMMPGVMIHVPKFGIYPEVMISSDVDQSVTATLVDESKTGNVSFCFSGSCVTLVAAHAYTETKSSDLPAGKPQNMEVEVVHQSAATAPYEVNLSLQVTGDKGGSFNGKLVLRYDPEAANNVASIHSSNSKNTLYTLSGQAVRQASKKGIYILNGRKVIR